MCVCIVCKRVFFVRVFVRVCGVCVVLVNVVCVCGVSVCGVCVVLVCVVCVGL